MKQDMKGEKKALSLQVTHVFRYLDPSKERRWRSKDSSV
jgi:hypothetical protein